MTEDQQHVLSICHPQRQMLPPSLGKRSLLFPKTFHFLVQLFSFSAPLRTIYRTAGKTCRNSPLRFKKPFNECRLNTFGQTVQLLEKEKEEKVVIGLLKAGLLNFPPSFLCKSGLMTSLHLPAGVTWMSLIPDFVLVTHCCIYSCLSPRPAPLRRSSPFKMPRGRDGTRHVSQ